MKKGSHHSEATKQKLRQKASHDPRPDDVKKQISETKLKNDHPVRGKHLTDEHRKNISISMRKRMDDIRGVWEENKDKIGDGSNVGKEESY